MRFLALLVWVPVVLMSAMGASLGTEPGSGFNRNGATILEDTKVAYENGLLSVVAKEVALEMLLYEISRQSGIEFILEDLISEKVTLQFKKVPLDTGLKKILKNQAYAFSYAEKTANSPKKTCTLLRRVMVLRRPGPGEGLREEGLGTVNKPSTTDPHQDRLGELTQELKRKFAGRISESEGESLAHLEKRVKESVKAIAHQTHLFNRLHNQSHLGNQDASRPTGNDMDADSESFVTQIEENVLGQEGLKKAGRQDRR